MHEKTLSKRETREFNNVILGMRNAYKHVCARQAALLQYDNWARRWNERNATKTYTHMHGHNWRARTLFGDKTTRNHTDYH